MACLEGLVFARAPVSGSYQLPISQKGAAGSSDIVQRGDISIGSGETGSLGIVSLSMSTKRYVAKLSVQWDDGAPDCKAGALKSAKQKLLEQENDVPGPKERPWIWPRTCGRLRNQGATDAFPLAC